jgi:uncharacterized protein (DUF58 family)
VIAFQSWYALLILAFVMGIALRMPWLVTFSVSMGIVFATSHFWNKYALQNVTYKRIFRFRRGFPDEKINLTLDVENNKWLPINWLKIEDRWPYSVGPRNRNDLMVTHVPEIGNLVNLYGLRWQQRTLRNFEFVFKNRGLYEVGPVTLESGDPFGFLHSTKEITKPEYLTVFPQILPLEKFNLSTEDPFGEHRAKRRLFEDPNQPMGIRDYHPEDDFKRIHWPATARTGELQVKVYTPVSSKVMMVCLNVSTTARPWLGVYPKTFEYLIEVSATAIYNGVQDGYSVGLLSNGSVAHSDQPFKVAPGKSKDQLGVLLQTLAGATNYVTAPFENYLLKSLSAIPIGAALVIVTSLVSPELLETLIRMKRYRMHTTLVSVDPSDPPEIPGVKIIHLPFEE